MAFALLVNPPSMTASQCDDVVQALEGPAPADRR
jgi:hypothetical protein